MTGPAGKYPKLFVSRQKNESRLWIPRKPRKIGVWVSGAEIQTSAVDTRTAVWVSTPEKVSKIILGKTRNFSRKFRAVSAPALYKNPAVKLGLRSEFARKTARTSHARTSPLHPQKNPRAHKNKIGTPLPPKKPKDPPLKRGMLWIWDFPAERTHFCQAPIKLARPFPAPELRTKILRTRGYF